MNTKLYTKLAWTGIRKNKQLYYPYLIAGIVMAAVFYILSFLSVSEVVRNLKGSAPVMTLLKYTDWAAGIFSVPFLFYTHSTLIKRRKKELGLYNILGMNKSNIFSLLVWETFMIYGIAAFGGLLAGVVFSKIAELGLMNIMGSEIDYRIYIEWKAAIATIIVFAGIYILILLNTLRQIKNNNPIELLHSESAGERAPKGRWLLAVFSLFLIGAGYVTAFTLETIEDSQEAFTKSFYSAGLILLGTFFLFIFASVFLCKLLQKNKKYYYKTAHFVTVSSMSYRMKRNGASLASICILTTAILVTLSFSVSFYVGIKTVIATRFPYHIGLTVELSEKQYTGELERDSCKSVYLEGIHEVLKEQNVGRTEENDWHFIGMLGLIRNGQLDLSIDTREFWNGSSFDVSENENICFLNMLSLENYNKLCGTSYKVSDGEILFVSGNVSYQEDSIILPNGTKCKIAETSQTLPPMISSIEVAGKTAWTDSLGSRIFLVIPNFVDFIQNTYKISDYAEQNYLSYRWGYGINLLDDYQRLEEIYSKEKNKIQTISETLDSKKFTSYSHEEKVDRAQEISGGLLFIMIIVNIVFAFVTALIMYYKQISEGYEDQKRFEIMRKIGMTTKEIKKSITSQILTVFGLPLFVAGFHLIFTSNVVHYILRYALMDDKPLIIRVMLISYCLFAVVYSLVYMFTSRTYFKIVNKAAYDKY